MSLHRDHIAGGAFVLAGALILAVSQDLPFGTLASPGAGMMPMLITTAMMAFGAVLFARAANSPPLSSITWTDFPHAVRVIVLSAAAASLYTTLGFLLTVTLLLFGLIFAVERRPLIGAAAFSLGVSIFTFVLFERLLKSPLPRGILGF